MVGSPVPAVPTPVRPGTDGRRQLSAAVWAGAVTVLIVLTAPTPAAADAAECSTVAHRLRNAHVQSHQIDSDAAKPGLSGESTRCRRLPGWATCAAIREGLRDQAARSAQDVAPAEAVPLGEPYCDRLDQGDGDPALVHAESTGQRTSPARDPDADRGVNALGTWVLVFVVGVVMVAPLVAFARFGVKRDEVSRQHRIDTFEAWANARGWTVHRRPPADRWWRPPGPDVDNARLVAEGRHDGHDVAVAYVQTEAPEAATVDSRMCMVRLHTDQPRVMVRRRVLPWTRGGRIGDPAFDRRFVLTTSDRDAGWSQALTGDLLTQLVARPPRSDAWVERLSVDGGRLVVHQGGWPENSDPWDGLVALAIAAARAIDRLERPQS